MSILRELHLLIGLTRSHGIARRYFVVNGFDGALAMLGLNMGFYLSDGVATSTAVGACMGTAIALGMSGVSSGYVSEAAEKKKELRELELAMATDLGGSMHGRAARLVPIVIAAVNGLAPFVMALLIITPLWLEQVGVPLPLGAVESAIVVAFVVIFLLGILLARISGVFWLWSGFRTLLIAAITALLVLFFAP